MSTLKKTIKNLTRHKVKERRTIETSLINKEEVFRMLSLAEATGLPLLLIGIPGVGKTKTVLDYAKGWMFQNVDFSDPASVTAANKAFFEDVYVLETDEGTKASEIKGRPDMEQLVVHHKFELDTPIADAQVAVINEVDKASNQIRNALLGVMNERFLFIGKIKKRCKWKLFVATCNEIPKDEINNPFWDRFVLKMTVNRITSGEFVNYFDRGGRDYREQFSIGIPDRDEVHAVNIPQDKLEKFLSIAYPLCSDRTLTYVPLLTKAVSIIWNVSVDKALIKVCSLLINSNAASDLQDKLLSVAMKTVTAKIEMLWTAKTQEQLNKTVDEIGKLVQQYAASSAINKTEMEEIDNAVMYILDNHQLEEYSLLKQVLEEPEFSEIE